MCALFSSTFTFRLNIFVILIFHFVSFRLRMIDGFSFLHCSSIIRHTCRSKLTRSQTVEARKSQFWHTDFLSRLKSHQLWHNCVWIVHSMPLSICTQQNENKKESAIFTFFYVNLAHLLNPLFSKWLLWMKNEKKTLHSQTNNFERPFDRCFVSAIYLSFCPLCRKACLHRAGSNRTG